MKGFKGFDKDLKCRDKQYEIGKEFTEECVPNLCHNGLHFCEFPLDVFSYYNPNFSRYAEVEATGEINGPEKDEDSKVCTNKLKICAEIGIPGIVSSAVEYVKEHIDVNKKQTVIEDSNKSSDDTEEGYQSAATNTGNRSAATTEGKDSVAISLGIKGIAKGSIGTWIVISEWEENGNGDMIRKDMKCFKVDGEKILPNTFYRLTDGEPEPIDVKDVDEYEEYCDNEE